MLALVVVVPDVVVPLKILLIMLPSCVLVDPPTTITVPPGPNEMTVPETVIGGPPGTRVCPLMTNADDGFAVIVCPFTVSTFGIAAGVVGATP